jgi:membrane protein required for colicin V production
MNLLDYLLIAITAFCLVRGVFRGVIKELSSIVGVIGGFYIAYRYYPWAAKPLSRWITNTAYLNIVSFLLLFIGICVIVAITAALIKYILKINLLGWVNRTGGGIFGAVKGTMISVVLILMLTTFLPNNAAVLKNSMAAQHLMRFSATLVQVASREIKNVFSVKMKELNKTWKNPKL